LVAIILLAAFGIERVSAAANFGLDWSEKAEEESAQRKRKVLLSAFGGAIALAIIDFGAIRIIDRLQPSHPMPLLDYWLTWLVVFAGSDRVKEFLGGGASGAPKKAEKEVAPIKIIVDEGLSARLVPTEVKPSCAA
jgi:hypothetical protein